MGDESCRLALIGAVAAVSGRVSGGAFGIFVESDLAYIAAKSGLVIADVSDPARPKQLGKCNSEGETRQVRVHSSYAYVASSIGLEIVDISDPGMPKPVARWRAPAIPQVRFSGRGKLYVEKVRQRKD